ncbi:unnamed protein product [Callosobruchus maculatus]|uniref:Spaetzle domain-containing protein n=1 Tax=Callosobruchus maculatus TaxID=64391 RepID=A0A653D6H4_CALMS|nr:unnamed protein product [Callosobruchus maculatus]
MMKYPSIILLLIVLLEFVSHYGQTTSYQFNHSRSRRQEVGQERALPEGLKDCDGGSCQYVDDYPQNKIDEALQKSLLFSQYFAARGQPDIGTRVGEPGKSLCSSHTQTYFYQKLSNTKGTDMYIVNHGNYKQGVQLEICEDDTSSCSSGDNLFDKKTKCEQKYSSRILLALGKDSEEVQFDTFKLPACCVCLLV